MIFYLVFSLAKFLEFYLANIPLSGIPSGMLFLILSGIPFEILSHIFLYFI